MATTQNEPTNRDRRRRADADRSEAAILDAAIDALPSDPDASMAEIARRAGVVRATVYVHFPTREDLIAAITNRAIAEATDQSEPQPRARATPPTPLPACSAPAGRRSGATTPSFTSTPTSVPNTCMPAQPILRLIRPLLRRGQASGALNPDLPVDWMLTVLLELIQAASREVTTGRLPADKAERALVDTIAGAFAPTPEVTVAPT